MDTLQTCLNARLSVFHQDIEEFNANLQHIPVRDREKAYIPWVGNGVLGVELVSAKRVVHIRHGRTLSLPVMFEPLVEVAEEEYGRQEAIVAHYLTGIVHRIQCFNSGLMVAQQYYAHRSIPAVLVQDIKVTNPNDEPVQISTRQTGILNWPSANSHKLSLQSNKKSHEYIVATGMVDVPDSSSDQVIAVSIVMQVAPDALTLWSTGFSISSSKAPDSLNGDKINATIYYVLSQVRSPLHEHISMQQRAELEKVLLYSEGCFGGYHTLQAKNLWPSLTSLPELTNAVSLWLLTLEKQGCHNLIKAGASGVVEAMVLSFGGLRFSNQHLEFNIHPKRINYGNLSHVNISVTLQDDNKAVLSVSLDRSDKNYYACDAGCLDFPVQLGPSKKTFPVKLTDPVTAILYITSDKQHMEELRHTIHVKEIAEAPAHEHHVIALHKHGHHLGGLPTFFWLLISFLIIVFHLFLIKLIYNEYCGSQDKYRLRYSKH
ncbi:hypothetical protein B566_EDAN014680 [Ephemera danica]|nr:hypothetical protein B566_EDAN014680 [Ephemera danica]